MKSIKQYFVLQIPDSLAQNPADLDSTDSEIEKKGMTFITIFDIHSSFLFFYEGGERGKRITKVVVKSHSFLLDLIRTLKKYQKTYK